MGQHNLQQHQNRRLVTSKLTESICHEATKLGTVKCWQENKLALAAHYCSICTFILIGSVSGNVLLYIYVYLIVGSIKVVGMFYYDRYRKLKQIPLLVNRSYC